LDSCSTFFKTIGLPITFWFLAYMFHRFGTVIGIEATTSALIFLYILERVQKHRADSRVPTEEDFQRFKIASENVSRYTQGRIRAATKFKPGELTPEDERTVEEKGLTALNYIPQRTIEKQARAFENYAQKMKDPAFREREDLRQRRRHRFNDFHYGWYVGGILVVMFILMDPQFKYFTDNPGINLSFWPIGAFCFLLMLALLEASYWVYAHRIVWFGGFLLAVSLLSTGLYSLKIYNQIHLDFQDSERVMAPPAADKESISEIGYIYDLRRVIDFQSREETIKWWVKISSTNKIYACDWQSGFSKFSKGQIVELIHKRSDISTDDYAGFIVGINGSQSGRSSFVWAVLP
jgi:hypothetical protein